jgi:hypothetical protein
MLYRAAIVAVVLFWAAMWTLLIRSELWPGETRLRKVPPELVLRQVFQQGQNSDLTIKQGTARMGHLRIAPRLQAETGERSLELLGNVQVSVPGAKEQRFYFDVSLDMNPELAMQRLQGTFSLRESAPRMPVISSLSLTMEPPQKRGSYRLVLPESDPVEEAFTLDEAGLQRVMQTWGIDLRILKSFSPTWTNVVPEITARQARLTIQREQVDTYLLTVRNAGQTLVEMHVSQLGQVLKAKTLLGWDLVAD